VPRAPGRGPGRGVRGPWPVTVRRAFGPGSAGTGANASADAGLGFFGRTSPPRQIRPASGRGLPHWLGCDPDYTRTPGTGQATYRCETLAGMTGDQMNQRTAGKGPETSRLSRWQADRHSGRCRGQEPKDKRRGFDGRLGLAARSWSLFRLGRGVRNEPRA